MDRVGEPDRRADRKGRLSVLDEFAGSGLDLAPLPGNSAKLRLILDLAVQLHDAERLRVLDVGCAGSNPLNLWAPFAPMFDRIDLTGVDIDGLDRVESRAAELGLDVTLLEADVLALRSSVDGEFDAVVSTQVLEHVPQWRDAVDELAAVTRRGGVVYITCDSGELRRSARERMRLVGKRVYARLPLRVGPFSGQWERGLGLDDLGAAAGASGLEVERLERHGLHDVKLAQRYAGGESRLLWHAFEESLRREAVGELDPGLFGILYLRARRP